MTEEDSEEGTRGTSIDKGEENFEWILDKLPFGISVQTPDRQIIYENKTVKELVGTYLFRQCYNRWHYLPERRDKPCPDCPAIIGFQDKSEHRIFRKTSNENGDDLFLEIQFIPILNKKSENINLSNSRRDS